MLHQLNIIPHVWIALSYNLAVVSAIKICVAQPCLMKKNES